MGKKLKLPKRIQIKTKDCFGCLLSSLNTHWKQAERKTKQVVLFFLSESRVKWKEFYISPSCWYIYIITQKEGAYWQLQKLRTEYYCYSNSYFHEGYTLWMSRVVYITMIAKLWLLPPWFTHVSRGNIFDKLAPTCDLKGEKNI